MENMKEHNDETPKKKKLLEFVKKRSKEEVVVNIKTITDIPPVQEARKKFGNGNNIGAVNGALNDISSDISRYFNFQFNPKYSMLYNIYKKMVDFEKDISPDIIVDRESFIIESAQIPIPDDGKEANLLSAIRKFGVFIFDVYNPIRYARKLEMSPDDVIKRMVEIYSYMDLKELFYPDSRMRR